LASRATSFVYERCAAPFTMRRMAPEIGLQGLT
jgi:hypothetical protein